MLTNDQLQAIRERCEKATPGPWEADGKSMMHDLGTRTMHPAFLGRITSAIGQVIIPLASFASVRGESPEICEANADFIAHAREDIPTLLEEINYLWARVKTLEIREGSRVKTAIAERAKLIRCREAALQWITYNGTPETLPRPNERVMLCKGHSIPFVVVAKFNSQSMEWFYTEHDWLSANDFIIDFDVKIGDRWAYFLKPPEVEDVD